jgi:hypothetical protein
MLKADADAAQIGSAEFFDRARRRLSFEVPPGLPSAAIAAMTTC